MFTIFLSRVVLFLGTIIFYQSLQFNRFLAQIQILSAFVFVNPGDEI